VRRCDKELTKLSHHLIRFESSGMSIPIIGLDDGVADRVAARWCAKAARRSGESPAPATTVLSKHRLHDASRGDYKRRFGPWRAVLNPGDGFDTVGPIIEGAAVSEDFHRAIDLCVAHALAMRGAVVVHGAAFDTGGRGVLVAGSSGSGKSTVVAGALRTGARVVSDDLLLVTRRPAGRIGVESLRRELFFRAPGVSIVPQRLVEQLVASNDGGATRWRLSPDAEPTSFAASVSPESLWLVAVDRRLRESRVTAVDQAEALASLVQGLSGLFLSAGFERERAPILDLLSSLVASCSLIRVRLGRDLLSDPQETMDRIVAATRGS
jgi:hypothetical protein